jgi:hypothetical protein
MKTLDFTEDNDAAPCEFHQDMRCRSKDRTREVVENAGARTGRRASRSESVPLPSSSPSPLGFNFHLSKQQKYPHPSCSLDAVSVTVYRFMGRIANRSYSKKILTTEFEQNAVGRRRVSVLVTMVAVMAQDRHRFTRLC